MHRLGSQPARARYGYLIGMPPRLVRAVPPVPQLRLVGAAGSAARSEEARSTPEQDLALLEAFQRGRPGAGADLYDRLFPVVDATIVRILGRREHDHADLVQSAFEQIVSTLMKRKYERGCTLAGWAAVLACHVGLNALRSRRRERGVVDRDFGSANGEIFQGTTGAFLEEQIRARDELSVVRKLLSEMDADRVTAMLLHASGYELTEIAALTKTSVAAAQSRLSRGRRELRSLLERAGLAAAAEPSSRRAP
jgi:RNA polymerase sigma-70 factor, ECF subfamily